MKRLLLILTFILIDQFPFAQQNTDLYGDYPGQTPPGSIPVVFARGVVSTELQNHGILTFTRDANIFPLHTGCRVIMRMFFCEFKSN